MVNIISTKDATQHGAKLLIFGASGSGKTYLIQTAEDPFIISSESGLLSLSGHDIPACEVKSEKDLAEAYKYAKDSDHATICIDSLSDIAETLLAEYKGRFTDGRQAYGLLGDTVSKYIRKFRNLKGKHVYFSAKESKTETNNVVVAQPSMPGQTLTINVPYFFDCVLRLEANKKGERVIHTAASFTQVCKDRSGKLDKTEPAHLGNIINKIIGD